MKLVFIGKLWGKGGAEKSLINVANSMNSLFGYDVVLVGMQNAILAFPKNPKIRLIKVCDCKSRIKLLIRLNRCIKLIKILKQEKPNIIITFGMVSPLYVGKLLKIKTIFSERGDPANSTNKGIVGFARRVIFPFVDGFVFQLESVKQYFNRKIQNKSIVIPNPVYIKYNDFPILKVRRNRIVNVGRLHKQKNQLLLLKAFKEISNEFPDLSLDIYGEDAGEEQNLKDYTNENGLSVRVNFKGVVDDIYNEIIDAKVFVLSSDYEGMPNALMEAMALGIPCVSTDCNPGGAKALIQSGFNGIIVKKNNVSELVHALQMLLTDSALAESIGKNAKKICYTNDLKTIMEKWNLFFEKVNCK